MMNIPESMGESSSKRQENGDAPSGSERPLKKARFAWQVKGKYHLKNDSNDDTNASNRLTCDTDTAGPSVEVENVPNSLVGSTEQNLEILGDYLMKQDFNTLDSVIADSEKTLLKPMCLQTADELSSMADSIDYPTYVSSLDNRTQSSSDCEHIPVTMSMIVGQKFCEDQCIARWQAKQMAKGFVDNTINRVLDSWSRPAPQTDMDDSRFLAINIAEFIDNMPDYNNSIENEGILMAISAHGLQNTSGSSDDSQEQTSNPELKENASLPSSPQPEELEPVPENEKTDRHTSTDLLWPYTETKPDQTEYSIYKSTSPCQYFNENDSIQTDNADYGVEIQNFDFMDTAVSFAILNKGLTTFGSDYG